MNGKNNWTLFSIWERAWIHQNVYFHFILLYTYLYILFFSAIENWKGFAPVNNRIIACSPKGIRWMTYAFLSSTVLWWELTAWDFVCARVGRDVLTGIYRIIVWRFMFIFHNFCIFLLPFLRAILLFSYISTIEEKKWSELLVNEFQIKFLVLVVSAFLHL